MAINVNYTDLTSLANSIDNNLTDMNAANQEASAAGDAAVAAAGGDGTAVGAAIRSAIQEDTANEFSQALQVISEMTLAMRSVSNTYSAENDELLSKIKTIASRNSSGGGGGGQSHFNPVSLN